MKHEFYYYSTLTLLKLSTILVHVTYWLNCFRIHVNHLRKTCQVRAAFHSGLPYEQRIKQMAAVK